ncbi:hypothetical protein [Flavobacterium sp.]|uniref:hypothetical protein n=1 Tax=Flavobacterium sp. TaxID=239 RepID=UPI004048BE84
MFRVNSKQEIDNNTVLEKGIYRIFWIKNGIPQHIHRIGGIDKTGLLYIGKTEVTLRARLNQFRCSAFQNSSNHSGGKKYRTNKKLKELIQHDEIFAEIVVCKFSPDIENEELKDYKDFFGEVPPLNG